MPHLVVVGHIYESQHKNVKERVDMREGDHLSSEPQIVRLEVKSGGTAPTQVIKTWFTNHRDINYHNATAWASTGFHKGLVWSTVKPIFHCKLGSRWVIYMANAKILRWGPNETYIPLACVGVLRWG